MIALALLVPVVLLLMMFGLDAFENRLFPRPPDEDESGEDPAAAEESAT
ncbi:hypothetical protein ACWCQK_31695 [Streptomyces sp. NPDC002306]